jgi:CRISPR-associated protein Cmr3
MSAGDSTGWVGLRLEPLDTLFFRDGRPFDAATRVAAGLPNPQALAGALRTALLARTGFDFKRFAKQRKHREVSDALRECQGPAWITAARFRGPWLARDSGNSVEPLLSLPEILAPGKGGGWSRARPERDGVPGWSDPDGLLPLWRRREPDPKTERGFLTLDGLQHFLDGNDPPEATHVKQDTLYGYDNRIGIGINMNTLTSEEGELYGIRLLSLKPGVYLYAEMHPGPGAPLRPWFRDAPVPFGGEGKYVRVEDCPARDWPKANPKRPRSMWYLATPTFLPPRGDWRRPLPDGVKSAASGPGVAVSGWDVARNGPRPTRFAVPAGAVYFLDGPGSETGFVGDDQDRNAAKSLLDEGWGFALQGAWKEERP